MQRFYRTSDGQWLSATARIRGEWPNDGAAKAARLAEALGVQGVEVVDLPDNAADPRTGSLLALPSAPAPEAPPDPVTVLTERVDALMARVMSVEAKIAAGPRQ